MVFDAYNFRQQLTAVQRSSGNEGISILIDKLIETLYQNPGILPLREGERILHFLRSQRKFELLQKLVEVFIQTGIQSFKIRRMYAQSLIDAGNFTSAITILNTLAVDVKIVTNEDEAQREYGEIQGLLGRVYKELYFKTINQNVSQGIGFMKQSINAYFSIYTKNTKQYLWHGINVAGLLYCAAKDNLKVLSFPDYEKIADDILKVVEEKYYNQSADAWDFATAGEACIALNRSTEALEWFSGYARMPYCDAFELASTLRQLENLWKLSMDSESGKLILPLLRAELLKREGGNVFVNLDEHYKQKVLESSTSNEYVSLVKNTINEDNFLLEKIFGDESFKTYKWYMKGANKCLAVARIGKDSTEGFGTGFLLKGHDLHKALEGELVLLTNACVISDEPENKALKSYEAIIVFEALNRNAEFRVGEIFWSSPTKELDVTIIRFNIEDQARLYELTKDIEFYPIAKYLPVVENDAMAQRVYTIGHPIGGGILQLSFQDNILLDHQDPKIHYRTPAEGNSAGSPVFNQQWDLIGLHHAGSKEMKRLNNKPGTYEAKEGIWIQAIIKALENALALEFESQGTVEGFMSKGSHYELLKRYEDALKTYSEGYYTYPEQYEFLKRMAEVFKGKGDVNQYLECLERYNQEKNRVTLESNLKKNLLANYFTIENHPFYGDLIWPINPQMNILLGKNGYGKSHLLSIMLALLQNNIQKTREFSPTGATLSITVSNADGSLCTVLGTGEDEEVPESQETIFFSDKGLESTIGKIPVLAIPDSRFIDKSVNFVSRSKESMDVLQDSALHFLYQKPYAGTLENALYRVCQIYTERKNKIKPLAVVELIETIFYKLTGGHFTITKIESMPSTEYAVWVNTEGAENLPIQKVSQGTFSIISIVLTIFNYLRARYPDVSDKEVALQNAIVFIDEIDAHLHPAWEQKILNILRETFPSIQFFITGHSPLIVAGCKVGEVSVLRKAESGFKLDFFEHDFIGCQPAELYSRIFEIESYDQTYLKYNSLLPFKEDFEKQIEDLKAKKDINKDEVQKLDQLYNDIYYMNIVADKNNEQKGLKASSIDGF